jgi:integrase
MSGFFQVSLPGTHKRYWLFRVSPKTAKGGKQRDIPVPRVVWDAFVAYRAAFGLPERPEANEDTLIILSPLTKELIINGKSIKRSADRRRFGDWREVATRQGLYRIVTARLETAAAMLTSLGRDSEAATLRMASPHWLRHAFGKALVLTGQHPREIAGAMGHASLDMAMIYTQQGAIDLINASERSNPGQLAVEDGV